MPEPVSTEDFRPRFSPAAAKLLAGAALLTACAAVFIGGYGSLPWAGLSYAVVPPFWQMTQTAFLGHLWRLAAVLWFAWILTAAGRRALAALRFDCRNPWEEFSLSFGLGAGLGAALFFLLGILHLLYPAVLAGILAAASLPALADARSFYKRWRPPPAAPFQTRISAAGWGALIFFLAFFLQSPQAFIPETFYDALEYHLELPHLYLLHHAVVPTPENAFAGIPGLTQMLSGWMLALDPWGVTAQLLHFSFALWIFCAFTGLAKRLGSGAAGPWAAAIFYCAPAVAIESVRTSVALEWALFQFLSAHALVAALEQDRPPAARQSALLLCGLFLGLAMSTKYPAWFAPAGFIIVWLAGRKRPDALRLDFRELLKIFAVALAVLLPWLIKNILFYHNPIYPFFHEFWRPGSDIMPDWRYVNSAGRDLKWTFLTAAGWLDYLQHPWRMSINNQFASSALGPVLLAACLLPALVRLPPKAAGLLWLFLGTWLPLSIVTTMPRFFIPAAALLCLLAGWILAEVRPPDFSRSLRVMTGLALAYTAVIFAPAKSLGENWAVFLGRQSFGDYLGESRIDGYPMPPFAGIDYINRAAPASAKVLIFGDARGFYLKRRHLMTTPGQPSFIEMWSNGAANPGALRAQFDRAGVTYVLVNQGEIDRLKTSFRFTFQGKANLDGFWKKYTLKEFELDDGLKAWVAVYRVLSEEEAARPHPADDLFAAYASKTSRR
ncbi:MAG: hypothetical protein HY611_03855 [Elusimicrobia bacterium]|nr:hypothetical protein [Elusimicrobiota bacterium]